MAKQIQRCRLGLSCALMMQRPGIDASGCENRNACGTLVQIEYTPEEREARRVAFVIAEQEREARWVAYFQEVQQHRALWELSRQEAAITMLLQRGASLAGDAFEIQPLVETIAAHLAELQRVLASDYGSTSYIAPFGAEVHHYWARGQRGRYRYNKLQAPAPIFEPSAEQRPVRMIHLSKDDDPRNLEARKGIERRKRLEHLAGTLRRCGELLASEIEALERPYDVPAGSRELDAQPGSRTLP